MAYFNEFPHTRNYDADLGWLIKHVKKLMEKFDRCPTWYGVWIAEIEYPPLAFVQYGEDGDTYLSLREVPANTPITDERYWMKTGSTSEQILELQRRMASVESAIETVEADVEKIDAKTKYWVNVKDFGAVGDSVADDTSALQAAIDYMQENRVGLYFPQGDYRVTQTLTIDENKLQFVAMRGDNQLLSVIRADLESGYTYLFDFSTSGTIRYAEISKLTMIGHTAGNQWRAININRMTHSIIHDVIFRNFVVGINATYSWCMVLYRCVFTQKSTGANQAWLTLYLQCNAWNIISCQFGNNEGQLSYAIAIARSLAAVKLTQCTIEYGLGITINTAAADVAPIVNVDIDNCYFEWMEGVAIAASATEWGKIKGVKISNCYLNAKEGASIPHAIDPRYINGLSIIGNYCTRYATQMISFSGAGIPTDTFEISSNTTDGIPVTTTSITEIKGMLSAAPTSGYHHRGEIIFNYAPTASNIGWVCTATGTPGTWIPINPS